MKFLIPFIFSTSIFAQDFGSYDNLGLVAELVSAYKSSPLIKNAIQDFEEQFHCQCKQRLTTFPLNSAELIATRFVCRNSSEQIKYKIKITSYFERENEQYHFSLKYFTYKEK